MRHNPLNTDTDMEMNQETLEKMKRMNLHGMHSSFRSSLENFSHDNMTNDQFISWLVTSEWDDRCSRSIERLIKNASFRYNAAVEEIDYNTDRGLDRNLMQRLAQLTFVDESRDLLVTGSTGTGKSYIVTALGIRACRKGKRVLYASTGRLLGQLKAARAKGNILREMRRIEHTDMLILDDFCLHPFDAASRALLMDLVEDRHGKRSTVVTSQIPVAGWYEAIGDRTLADAILDRIVHRAIRIELHGESLRKMKSKDF